MKDCIWGLVSAFGFVAIVHYLGYGPAIVIVLLVANQEILITYYTRILRGLGILRRPAINRRQALEIAIMECLRRGYQWDVEFTAVVEYPTYYHVAKRPSGQVLYRIAPGFGLPSADVDAYTGELRNVAKDMAVLSEDYRPKHSPEEWDAIRSELCTKLEKRF